MVISLRASQAVLWGKCSNYLKSCLDLGHIPKVTPTEEDLVRMQNGTDLHKHFENFIKGVITEKELISYEKNFKYCIDYIAGAEVLCEYFLEGTVEIGGRTFELTGSADVLVLNPETKKLKAIIDLKTGYSIISPRRNRQLLSYLHLYKQHHEVEPVVDLIIFNLNAQDVITKESVDTTKARVINKEYKTVTGSHCNYCPFITTCKALDMKIEKASHLEVTPTSCSTLLELGKVMATKLKKTKEYIKDRRLPGFIFQQRINRKHFFTLDILNNTEFFVNNLINIPIPKKLVPQLQKNEYTEYSKKSWALKILPTDEED